MKILLFQCLEVILRGLNKVNCKKDLNNMHYIKIVLIKFNKINLKPHNIVFKTDVDFYRFLSS
jgi:hypothetical protein